MAADRGISRRTFVLTVGTGALVAGLGGPGLAPRRAGAAAPQPGPGIGPEEAIQRLVAGNARYVTGRALRPRQTAQRRAALARSQQPFVAVLGCSDSRVPPEIAFDQGLGDLFVVRVAGNVADDFAVGSLEYAVAVLGVPLVLVLGHERCGAVEAAVKGDEVPGHLGSLVRAIQAAADSVRGQPGDPLDNAVRANVTMVVNRLRRLPPVLADRIDRGALRVAGARYDLDSGAVDVIA